jgi:hypothetical protein
VKFTLDPSEKKLLVRNMWKVYTRLTGAPGFFYSKYFIHEIDSKIKIDKSRHVPTANCFEIKYVGSC